MFLIPGTRHLINIHLVFTDVIKRTRDKRKCDFERAVHRSREPLRKGYTRAVQDRKEGKPRRAFPLG